MSGDCGLEKVRLGGGSSIVGQLDSERARKDNLFGFRVMELLNEFALEFSVTGVI